MIKHVRLSIFLFSFLIVPQMFAAPVNDEDEEEKPRPEYLFFQKKGQIFTWNGKDLATMTPEEIEFYTNYFEKNSKTKSRKCSKAKK